jgi:hypothetical protein
MTEIELAQVTLEVFRTNVVIAPIKPRLKIEK